MDKRKTAAKSTTKKSKLSTRVDKKSISKSKKEHPVIKV